MLFQYKCIQQILFLFSFFFFSPSLHYTDEYKEQRGLSEYSTRTSKSTNTTHGHKALK